MIYVVEKICTTCKVVKLSEFFYKDKSRSDGLSSSCKVCKKRKKHDPSDIESKICSNCKNKLSIDNFTKNANIPDGYNRNCKKCTKILRKEVKDKRIAANPLPLVDEKLCTKCLQVKKASEFRINMKSTDNLTSECLNCLPKSTWTVEKQRESDRKYRKNNPDKMRAKYKKAGESINRRIRDTLNHRICDALYVSNLRKDNSTLFYTGCTIEFLKEWIVFQFEPGMSWSNYGEWEIDHVKPCCAYDLSVIEQQYKCFNWRNLQPLWKKDNMKKSGIVDYILIKSHRKLAYEFELYFSAQVKECELLELP